MVRQVDRTGRQTKRLGGLFRTEYLAFGNNLIVLNAIYCFGNTKTKCFSLCKILNFIGCILLAAVLGACVFRGM